MRTETFNIRGQEITLAFEPTEHDINLRLVDCKVIAPSIFAEYAKAQCPGIFQIAKKDWRILSGLRKDGIDKDMAR